MKWYTRRTLNRWGIAVVDRPDVFDHKNRWVTIVIDERITDVVFIDPLSITCSSDALDELVTTISLNVCDEFMEIFIKAINIYSKWMMVLVKKEHGTVWWKNAIDRVETILDMYGVHIKRFQKLDYEKCATHFGSRRAFNQVIIDAISYGIEDFPKCLICKHCKCKRNGTRICNKVFTPVDDGCGVKTLRMVTDYPISNRIADISKTFAYHEECECFEENPHSAIDYLVRMRNAHF